MSSNSGNDADFEDSPSSSSSSLGSTLQETILAAARRRFTNRQQLSEFFQRKSKKSMARKAKKQFEKAKQLFHTTMDQSATLAHMGEEVVGEDAVPPDELENTSVPVTTSTPQPPPENQSLPQGPCKFLMDESNIHVGGQLYFQWAFCHLLYTQEEPPTKKKLFYCLGCYICPVPDCPFKQRPQAPQSGKRFGAPAPPPCKVTECATHHKDLVWMRCTGGDSKSTRTKVPEGVPTWVNDPTQPTQVTVQHFGTHNHPPPPPS
jgi:hypothetical protein